MILQYPLNLKDRVSEPGYAVFYLVEFVSDFTYRMGTAARIKKVSK